MPVADLTKRTRYYVSNSTAGTLQVVDGFTNNIIRTYGVGVGAEQVVISKDGIVYVASISNEKVTAICLDGSTKEYDIPNNGSIEVDSISGRIFATTGDKVTVYDISTGALINTITGFTNALYVTLNQTRNRLYVLDEGNSNLKIYNSSNLGNISTVAVGLGASYVLVNDDVYKAYVSNTTDNTISIIDLNTNNLITTITLPAGSNPAGLALKEGILYVANNGLNNVTLISDVAYSILSPTIPVSDPLRLTFTPDGMKLLATNNVSGTLTIINPISKSVEGSIALGGSPFDVKAAYLGADISPGDPIDLTDSYQLDDIKESVCVIADKVFAHCQQRECFGAEEIDMPTEEEISQLPPGPIGPFNKLESIKFENGYIEEDSLIISPLPERPNFSRVRFTLIIPYKATFSGEIGSITVERQLEPIYRDIILFIPESRDEFNFDIIPETRSDILNSPSLDPVTNNYVFAAGVFIVIKVVGKVQLLVPAFGYCPVPPEAEEYVEEQPEDVCKVFEDFEETPFPEDFFPPQYQDLGCDQ